MSFLTLDIDAIDTAFNSLYNLYRDVEHDRNEHNRRARDTQNSLGSLCSHNFTGLENLRIEQIWNDLPFGALAWEFQQAGGAIDEATQTARQVFDTLIQAQQGLLEDPLHDLCDPALGMFGPIAGPLSELGGWLSFYNIWRIIENPRTILDLLDAAERAYQAELDEIERVRAALQNLEQRALLFIQELEKPLEVIPGEVVTVAGNAKTISDFLRDLRKDRSILRVMEHASPHLGALDVVIVLLGWFADPHRSLHSLEASLIGAGVAALVAGTGVGLLVESIDAGVSLIAHVESWGYDAAGRIEGGRWGARLEQVGYDWERTAGDADAMGDMFNDTGAAIIDMPKNVIAAEVFSPPGLAPVAAAAVLGYDELTGQGTQAFNNDVVKFATDTWHLVHVVPDAERSLVNSAVVSAGDDAHRLTRFLPQGVRQSVDNRIYDFTSWAMIGG